MRISQFQAIANILFGDAETLARGYHQFMTNAGTDFEAEEARRRCAIAVNAVGLAVDPNRYRTMVQALEAQRVEPVCKRCGSTDLSRDASAIWDSDAQQWDLCAIYDSTTCEACTAESDDLYEWRPLTTGTAQPPASDTSEASPQTEGDRHG